MVIVNQWKTAFFTTEGMYIINVAPKASNGYDIFMNCSVNGKDIHHLLGKYKDEREAQYVLTLLFDAYTADTDFEMPAKDEIPDLRILKGRGHATSMKVSHGGS